MFSLHMITFVTFCLIYLHISKCENKKLVPCFSKNVRIEIHQFDQRILLKYLNCTRLLKKHVFTIMFELQRQFTRSEQMLESNMVVTLFASPCSSSAATLSNGRTFPSTHGSLDGSDPSPIASSHLPWNGQSQYGTISYEYGGGGGDHAQLISTLIHVVIRHGREDMIKGIYVIKFHS
ncbi:hypothetical protein I4U23_013810 [Adineta vaga]|nr:hypothetical protein I4U23_013810 [Adineta vaga]